MPLKVPPVNAQLVRVTRYGDTGEVDDYGDPILADATIWQGSASAYTTERHEAVPASGGGTLLTYVATVAIPSTLTDLATSLLVIVEPGDKLVYLRAGVEQTRVVDAVEDRSDAGFNRLYVRDAG